MKKTTAAVIFVLTTLNLFAVDITIDTGNSLSAISPLIYGTNQDMEGPERVTLRRFGGNRTTGYNWETNYSHAGEDWYNVNDWWLCTGWYGLTNTECSNAGALPAAFHADSLTMGADSLITIQMAGYVAADQASTVTLAETAPSSRWHEVVYEKGSAFQYPPDTSDNYVYMDEFVDYLYDTFGGAAAQDGIKYYALDNEPALWDSTHPRIHPTPVYCSELISESTTLAKSIKSVDPDAEIFSPVLFGFSAYEKLDDQDWASVQGAHEWFISWFLEQMASAETTEGMRLIDYLDIHYYSEAREGENFTYNDEGVERVTSSGCTGPDCETARMHAPRMLWDDSYTENSWLGEWCMWAFPLLPKLQESIDTYYPGTKLAFTEWAFGGGNNYSGGIAYADTLGIFGKYGVDAATMWKTDYGPYHSAAFRLFRNYDSAGSAYGSTKVYCESNDTASMPVYASIEGGDDTKVHIIVLNRSGAQQTADISITGPHAYTYAEAWAFDDTSPDITARTAPVISSNSFSYTISANSAFHFFIQTDPGSPTHTRTITQTHTITPTMTDTPDYTATPTQTITPTWPPYWIENFDDGNNVIMVHEGRDGPWYDTEDGTGTQVRAIETGGASPGMAMHYYGSGFTDWGSGIGFNFVDPGGGSHIAYDGTVNGYTGIKFWAKVEAGSDTQVRVQFPNAQTHPDGGGPCTLTYTASCWDSFGMDLTLTETWTMYELPYSSLTQAGWGYDSGTFDASEIYNMEFRHNTGADYDVWIDDIMFFGPTPADTPTHTPSATRTATGTYTATRTYSPSPSATFSSTRTYTPHYSSTATLTVTMTVTGTPPTMTSTPTRTTSFTRTPTGTPSVTFSATKTATLTQTSTFSFTATYSYTFIPTFTATISFTVTKTQTAPATFSETQTPNATATFTATPVYSPVPTAESGELTVEDPFIYPNPYNPEIGKKLKISFHINKPVRNIRLKIYTMAKRMVRHYIWKEDKIPGKHVVKLDGKYIGSLSSGVYAYLILAEGNDGKISRASADVLIILR